MVELSAVSPFAGAELPVSCGGMHLAETEMPVLFSVAPYPGQRTAVEGVLGQLPIGRRNGDLIWSGLDQWFLSADPEGLDGIAAVTDQSDAWAMLDLTGEGWRDVLARLSPLDADRFEAQQVARTEVAHMAGIVIGLEEGVRLGILRSFARTLHHHLVDAMQSVTAQSVLSE
ncbi:sarcosine oxidase subunit gamma [Pontivivens insulae]|uniref:sarcosine oxidase subunit gamma n=1 Tax=Pontivivens insulae TaxID=1639689 RepID=UPI0013C3778B|nr:sarcosine oxidase subunit gamma [Pontivivens insulae]